MIIGKMMMMGRKMNGNTLEFPPVRVSPVLFILIVVVPLLQPEVVVAPDPSPSGDASHYSSSRAIVMHTSSGDDDDEDVWKVGEKRFYHQNRCKIKLQNDGNFVVQRLVGPFHYQTYQTSWHTGGTNSGGGSSRNYNAKLAVQDGSLIVYYNDEDDEGSGDDAGHRVVIYTSNIGHPESLNDYLLLVEEPSFLSHRLTINEQCILEIFRDYDNVDDDSSFLVWTNNRSGGLGGEAGISDYLQKGEMIHMNICYQNPQNSCNENEATTEDDGACLWYPNALILQHDCNLIQFRGYDWADYLQDDKVILWTSNTSRQDGNDEVEDCYLYSDIDRVRLYAGTLDKSLGQFEPRGDPILWDGPEDFENPCSGGYEVLLSREGGLIPSC